jgi:hypothetical protein
MGRHEHISLGCLGVLAVGLGAGCSLEIFDTVASAGAPEAADAETSAPFDEGDEGGPFEGTEDGGEASGEPWPIFDVGGEQAPVSSCQFAAQFPSHVGCEFYGLDLDGPGLADEDPFGFVVINPLTKPVEVQLERQGDRGGVVVQSVMVAAETERVLLPEDAEVHGSGLHDNATFRITGTAPIVVIQATPAAGVGTSSSATMLQPTAAWSARNPVAGWRTHEGVGERSLIGVVSRTAGTQVAITPMFDIADAPAWWADHWLDPQTLVLPVEPGQLLRLDAGAIDDAEVDHGTSGSTVESGQEHLVSVFSAHTCAAIPDYEGSCGHMQEQLSPRLVGTHFLAPRLVAVDAGLGPDAPLGHERTMFQVVATEPDTEVVFSYFDGQGPAVLETVIIDPDEPYAVYEDQRDLAIVADRPIVAATYMTNAELTGLGSPSMVQLAPVEQWSTAHWVWVPEGYDTHLLVASGTSAIVEIEWISGLADADEPQAVAPPLDSGEVTALDLEPWLLRRYTLAPGIYRVESSTPASVVVAGWRPGDGYAYLGGWGSSLADLGPAG